MQIGRFLLGSAATVLLATAGIHAWGQSFVDRWLVGLRDEQVAAIDLVWITDSIDWTVVALIWGITAWKQERGWLGASKLGALIPFAMFVGIMRIAPTFFGGWLLLLSVVLAGTGILLTSPTQSDA